MPHASFSNEIEQAAISSGVKISLEGRRSVIIGIYLCLITCPESPTGHLVKGARPFGGDCVDVLDTNPPQLKAGSNAPYRYQFGDFKTPGKIGLSCEKASLYITPDNTIPYEFRFSVPDQYDGDAPWMKEPENPKDSILKQAGIKGKESEQKAYVNKLKAIKKWIEKDRRSVRIDRNELYK